MRPVADIVTTSVVRCAAVDCGTNSIRLLVADVATSGSERVVDVVRETRIVRLGEGVDRTGRLSGVALERTRVALSDYATTISSLRVGRVRMVATSATRDAVNRADFVAMVHAELGVDPEVIDGVEEAALSLGGAASAVAAARGPLLVADIGGGSTELVRGGGEVPAAYSMNVGCVRLTERHLHGDPPTGGQIAAAVGDIRTEIALAREHVELDPAVTFVGVAGTVLTLAALVDDARDYDEAAIHGARMTAAQVDQVTHRLLGMTRAQRRALPAMHPGRADVIGAGALVLRTLVEEIGVGEVTASAHDILDGIVLRLARP